MRTHSSVVFWLSRSRAVIILVLLFAGVAFGQESTAEVKKPVKVARPLKDLTGAENTPLFRKSKNTKSPKVEATPQLKIDHLIVGVVGLALALWLGLWLIKKYVPGSKQLFSTPAMEVLGRTHLDPQRYIALVRVGSRVLVIGAGPDGINSLSEISDEKEVTSLLEVATPKTEAGISMFQKIFTKQIETFDKEVEEIQTDQKAEEMESDISSLRDRVRDLRDNE